MEWNCSWCTYLNQPSALQCSMCQQEKAMFGDEERKETNRDDAAAASTSSRQTRATTSAAAAAAAAANDNDDDDDGHAAPSSPLSLSDEWGVEDSSSSSALPTGVPMLEEVPSLDADWGAVGGADEAAWDDDEAGTGEQAWGEAGEEEPEMGEEEEMEKSYVSPASQRRAAPFSSLSSSSAAAAAASSSHASPAAHASSSSSSSSSLLSPSSSSRSPFYTLFSPPPLHSHIRSLLEALGELLGLNVEESWVLMRHFNSPSTDRWNQQRIEAAWFERAEQVREESGVGEEKEEGSQTADPSSLVECITCGDEVPPSSSFSLSCGHTACVTCWSYWVEAEFDKGPVCINTKCQGPDCSLILPSDQQMRFLSPDKRGRVEQWLRDDFVAAHAADYKPCPHSNCQTTAKRKEGVAHVGTVRCHCKEGWCFDCGLADDHRPTSCADVKRWNEKNSSDAENVNWIVANTKGCPNCKVFIEKNQGCNHMTCRKCSHEFCWLCKGNWRNHQSCSNYQETAEGQKEAMQQEEAQLSLRRYMHYYTRFQNHEKSVRFAEKTREQAHDRSLQLQDLKGTGCKEVQFLMDAIDTVIENKKMLQWLYVYAFYLQAPEGSSARALFDLQHSQLETFTDELQGLTEQNLDDLVSPTMRVKIISFCSTVAKYRRGVMEAIEQANRQREEREEEEEEGQRGKMGGEGQDTSHTKAETKKRQAGGKKSSSSTAAVTSLTAKRGRASTSTATRTTGSRGATTTRAVSKQRGK